MALRAWNIALAGLCAVSCLVAQHVPDKQLHQRILSGIEATLQQDYQQAESTFRAVISDYPRHPAGYLYLAGALQAEFSDYEQRFNQQEFETLVAKAESLGEEMINSSANEWGFYYSGTARSYRSFSKTERGDWYGGIIDAVGSATQLDKCLKLNPAFDDAKSGLGTYYYWRSKKMELFSWLPFIGDRRREGIEMLSAAAAHGTYDRFLAANSLMWVLMEEAEYDKALEVAAKVLRLYPGNRSFLWGVVSIRERSKDSAALKPAVAQLLASVLAAPVRNYFSEITCRVKLAQIAMKEHDYQEAIKHCTEVLRYRDHMGETRHGIDSKIRRAAVMLNDARNVISKK